MTYRTYHFEVTAISSLSHHMKEQIECCKCQYHLRLFFPEALLNSVHLSELT